MSSSFFSSRKPRPRFREEGQNYAVSWRLHRNQAALTGSERDIVAAAVQHAKGVAFELHAWVVMDDHVHVVLTPFPTTTLDAILHSWKSYSANRLMKTHVRVAPIWQPGWFDRVVFANSELGQKVDYAAANPQRRWPDVLEYPWVWPKPSP